jgi:hypothetical protein
MNPERFTIYIFFFVLGAITGIGIYSIQTILKTSNNTIIDDCIKNSDMIGLDYNFKFIEGTESSCGSVSDCRQLFRKINRNGYVDWVAVQTPKDQ